MAVIRRDALFETCGPHLHPGEDVLECVEATVIDVDGRSGTTAGIDRVILALTGHRLLTLSWPLGAEPVVDGSVPIGFLAGARVEDAGPGAVLTVSLTTGAAVRFGVGAPQEPNARDLALAVVSDTGDRVVRGPVTEELPVVGTAIAAPRDGASMQLAKEITDLCERNHGRVLELTPGLVVSAADNGASTYYVHVSPPTRPDGGCPRCEHVNRDGAVFCDACGALL